MKPYHIGTFVLSAAMAAALATPAVATVTKPAVECRVELDQNVRNAFEGQKAVIKVALKAGDLANLGARPPVNLAIALDRSGSMTVDKLAKVKEAAVAAVRKLGPEDVFSLVVYAQNVETVVPARNVDNAEEIVARINAIAPSKGNTSLFGGISIAAHEIRKTQDKRYVRRIILLSDGKANSGPSGVDDLGRLAYSLKKENISVTTVGVGNDYNEDLMTILASRSDGNTYYVKATDDLPRVFTAELGDVLSVIAKNVSVDITCPDGVVPTSIINREGKIKGQKVTLGMNQLYGGQEKYALVEVMIPQSKATGTVEIANATAYYDNTFTLTNESANGRANLRFSQQQSEIAASANGDMQRDLYENYMAIAQNKAIELADEGKILLAAEELRRNSTMLRWNGTVNNDTQLLQSADAMDKQAEQIGSQGISPEARKAMRADSYQIMQQQLAR